MAVALVEIAWRTQFRIVVSVPSNSCVMLDRPLNNEAKNDIIKETS